MKKIKKIFVCEKESQLQCVIKLLAEEGDIGFLTPPSNYVNFNFPNNISFKKSPYFNFEPKYKLDENNKNYYSIRDNNLNLIEINDLKKLYISIVEKKDYSEKFNIYENAKNFLSSYDEIIFACECNYNGVRSFQNFFETFFNISDINLFGKYHKIKTSFIKFQSRNKKEIFSSFEKREEIENNKLFDYFVTAYKKKDFIDYNYNINSIIYFSDILRKIGLNYNELLISKELIQCLNIIKNTKKIEKNKLIKKLVNKNLGINKMNYLDTLLNNSLLEQSFLIINNEREERISLSEFGEEFLTYISLEILNKNLYNQINEDTLSNKINYIDFKEKYSKIINNIFIEQKRILIRKNYEENFESYLDGESSKFILNEIEKRNKAEQSAL